jgi:hypothetical protein
MPQAPIEPLNPCVRSVCTPRRNPSSWGSHWYELRYIKAVRTINGKREWLCAWAGEDENGRGWDDTWEPTCNVSELAIVEYRESSKEHTLSTISVDPRPLFTLVNRSIGLAMTTAMRENNDTFGHKHILSIPELSLLDLARHFMQHTADTHTHATVKTEYDPKLKQEVTELRFPTARTVGDFCSFERRLPDTAYKSLRFRLGRKHNVDMVVVGCLALRYYDNRSIPGLVTFEASFETAKINGIYGTLTGPHQTNGHLSKTSNMDALRTYVRSILPELPFEHPLVKKGWHKLRPDQPTLSDERAVPDH